MANKFIKFELVKDLDKNVIVFKLLYYNSPQKLDQRTVHISFKDKRVYESSYWPHCFINEEHFSICFCGDSDYINPRESYGNKKNYLFRITTNEQCLNKKFVFTINDGENIDVMYSRIIESFKIISNVINK